MKVRMNEEDRKRVEGDPEVLAAHPEHMRVCINVSMDFEPGAEDFGSYLVRKAEELRRMGEDFRRRDEEYGRLTGELAALEEMSGEAEPEPECPRLNLLPGWEELGEY